ncbi:aspartate/glutamate racemase family protein [Zymomonas mobilis]|uniref:aspartate/glutamate racemase family protein n=1 Tax=Zymomonas mobilis TaxID=542 RepID=UPI0039EBBF3F
MKKLGLIGGIGPESTLLYYKKLVYGANNRIGSQFYPNLTVESLNVFDILRLCENKNYTKLTTYLMHGVNNLIAAGADVIALTGNTPHIVFDDLQKQSDVPLISIVEATCDEVKRQNITKVGLLGTRFTMEADFFKKPLIANGMSVITPQPKEIDYIANKIDSELEKGIFSQNTLSEFISIISRMRDSDGIEAIILGCTELPLLFKNTEFTIKSLDTMEIHINALLNIICDQN